MGNPDDEQAQKRRSPMRAPGDPGRVISGKELARLDGKSIAFFGRSDKNDVVGHFVTSENAGNAPLNATRDAIGPWETFVIRVMGNDTVALRAVNSSVPGGFAYVTAEN